MAKITFLSVLKNNLNCAFCKNKNCPVRYMPERKRMEYCDGTRYVTICEKEKQAKLDTILKMKTTCYERGSKKR